MAGVSSTSAIFKAAVQASKGTPKTALLCGMMEQHGINVAFDAFDDTAEHGCRTGVTADRATVKKTPTRRAGYLVRGSLRGALYPNLIGVLLRGAGFAKSTSGSTEFTHTFTLAERDSLPWLTVLSTLGDRERRVTDARVSRLTFEAGTQGIRYNGTLVGITEGDSAGTETSTAETLIEILPSEGSLVINYDPDDADTEIFNSSTDTLNRLTLDIANGMDEADQSLFRFTRADFAQQGIDVTGRVEGLELDYDLYDYIIRGGTSEIGPAPDPGIFSMAWTWESAVLIDTHPYSMTVTIPHVEMSLDDFAAEGSNVVRWNTMYRMIDQSANPITIALVNAYAGTLY